ncbi:alpha/beta-hydrolase [Meredithblackwellia eburnea MCA 4105]
MAFIDVPSRGLRAFYLCNPENLDRFESFPHPLKARNTPYDPSKPTILFIVGSGASSEIYFAQFNDARLHKYNLISIDLRFHGRTTEEVDPSQLATRVRLEEPPWFNLEEIYDDFEACLEVLNLPGPFHVVGEGRMGTRIACSLAARKPKLVKSLLLVGPGSFAETPQVAQGMTVDFLRHARRNKNGNGDASGRLDAKEDVDTYMWGGAAIGQDMKTAFSTHFEMRYGEGQTERDLSGWIKALFGRAAPSMDLLAKVGAPTLILLPEHDVNATEAGYEAWRDALSGVPGGATMVHVASAAILACYTAPTVVNRIIANFVNRNETSN